MKQKGSVEQEVVSIDLFWVFFLTMEYISDQGKFFPGPLLQVHTSVVPNMGLTKIHYFQSAMAVDYSHRLITQVEHQN